MVGGLLLPPKATRTALNRLIIIFLRSLNVEHVNAQSPFIRHNS